MATARLLMIFVFIILSSTYKSSSHWTSPNSPRLPHPDGAMAVAHYNNTIHIFGGTKYQQQMTLYNIATNTFTLLDTDYLSITFGYQQYYTQINNILYWIDPLLTDITLYNLMDREFEQSLIISDLTSTNNDGACLASSYELLFYLGGWGKQNNNTIYGNISKMYNVSSGLWSDIPSMRKSRAFSACTVDPVRQQLYVIGGYIEANAISNDIERINIIDIDRSIWIYIDNLLTAIVKSRAIYYDDWILIIGGEVTLEMATCDTIQLIDCKTGKVSNGGHLSYPVSATTAILVDNVIYAFGGMDHADVTGRFQYLDLSNTDWSMDANDAEKRTDDIASIGSVLFLCCFGCTIILLVCNHMFAKRHVVNPQIPLLLSPQRKVRESVSIQLP